MTSALPRLKGLLDEEVDAAAAALRGALDPNERSMFTVTLARAERRAGRVEEARARLVEALDGLRRQGTNLDIELALRLTLADCLGRLGHTDEAEQELAAARALQEQLPPDRQEQAYSLTLAGHQCQYRGAWDEAIPHYERAAALYRSRGDVHGATYCTMILGAAHQGVGNIVKAIAYYHSALKDAISAGDTLVEAMCYANLAALDCDTIRPREAEQRLLRSLELARQLGEVRGLAMVHEFLGRAHVLKQRFREALQAFDASLGLLEGRAERRLVPTVIAGKAEALLGLGRLGDADTLIAVALAQTSPGQTPEGRSRVLRAAALVRHAQGRWQEARELLRQSAELAHEHRNPLRELHALRTWSRLARQEGDDDEAAQRGQAAVALARATGFFQLALDLEAELLR